ncbi:unnamed protein product [Didymodactylos carnosus]|uniref:Uncharacterized protein n=1 Tax=Didymodactylos carnosus TaxID=1234261 RepID=A0A816G149_9BILA|nr:unnamed protein product [Didymodactylos carnosus]CAF4633895.1 unnamed protein product [Didymodactylos carnosus]
MNRGESPILILSYDHQIKELQRSCTRKYEHIPPSALCLDTTFNIGRFFVTPTTFRNSALQLRRTKKSPVHMGPTMIHYGNKSECYES